METWESGRRRPSPKFLRRMVQIAPKFSREIRQVLANYQWHNGRKKHPRLVVPIRLSAEVEALAGSLGMSTRMALRESLCMGMVALKRRGSRRDSQERHHNNRNSNKSANLKRYVHD